MPVISPVRAFVTASLAMVATATTSVDAHAYDMGWLVPPEKAAEPVAVPVTIQASQVPLLVELYDTRAVVGREPPIAGCSAPCRMQVPVGSYRLYVHETSDTRAGGRVIQIPGASVLDVAPRPAAQEVIGLALGIGGTAALITGMVLLTTSLSYRYCVDTCAPRTGHDYTFEATALLLGGAVVTPIGWVMFGKSFHPGVDVIPSGQSTVGRAVIPERRSQPVGLGLTMSF